MRLLVSIHDVTPALAAPVQSLWELCRRAGVTPALLLVPEWHGAWALEEHPAFVAWVRECADGGAEILLHGERHDEVGLPRRWRDSLRAVGRTAGEGEFLTLDGDAAAARITRGLVRLRALGLDPVGFVPPAWLAREATHHAVAALGLRVSEDVSTVRVHPRRARVAAPALRWSGRSTLRARGSVLAGEWRWRMQRNAPLMRLALHPQDLSHTVTAHAVRRDTMRWASMASAIRYADV